MDKKELWNILKLILKIGVTALLVYLVFQKIDTKALKNLVLESNPVYIFLAFICYLLSAVIGSWRSLSLLKSIGLHLNFGFNLRLYFLGLFYNVSLPGGVGGDGYKIYILRKKFRLPAKRIFLAMLFDRLSGLWAIGLISVVLILLIPQIDIPKMWPVLALITGTGIYFAIMRYFFKDYSQVFMNVHIKAMALQSLQLLVVIFILLSQDFDHKFSPYLFSFLVSTLAANLPISPFPGGAGVREYVMIHASGFFGMDANLAVFLSITFYIISTLSGLTGVWFVYRSKEFEPMPGKEAVNQLENDTDQVPTIK